MNNLDFENLLKIEVEKIFRKKIIDKWDSELLSKEIYLGTKKNISYQTIRRFWNLISSRNSISIQSKNIFSEYVGYNDFDNFKNSITKNSTPNLDWSFIKNWSEINTFDAPLEDSVYWHDKLSQSFASFVLTNEAIFESFSKFSYKNEVIKKYIISYHLMYDNLAKDWYLRGLNLFFRNNEILHYYLFVANIKYMSCVFTDNKDKISLYAKEIETLLPKIRKKYGIIWSLEARSLSALLYYYHTIGNHKRFHKIKNEILTYIDIHKSKIFEIDNYKIFLFFICDLLNVYKFQQLSDILQTKYDFLEDSPSPLWKNGYQEASKIVRCFTLFKNDEVEKSRKIFNAIDLSKLNFDFKNYFIIQYYLIALGLCSEKSKKNKISAHLKLIINETGLIYFNSLMND